MRVGREIARSPLHRTGTASFDPPSSILLPLLLTVHCDEQIEFILCHLDELLNLSEPDSLLDLVDVLLLLADRQAVLRQTADVLVVQRLELRKQQQRSDQKETRARQRTSDAQHVEARRCEFRFRARPSSRSGGRVAACWLVCLSVCLTPCVLLYCSMDAIVSL